MNNLYQPPFSRFDKYNTCIISKKSFDEINNLYKFKPTKMGNSIYYYNKKRNCYAIYKNTDKILNSDSYYIDKTWFKDELYATNSETLQKIGNVTPELYYIISNYQEMKDKEKHRYKSLIDDVSGSLNELLELVKT